ncbi:MAG: RNase H family protein [Candidatus Neomarinimicrobiota bacterium]|jgi:ribonuclease HI|nr:reverse transcriptase-like protein [Candidatus Neomarinimicrobiota bacterium]MDX9780491.1 RNase H family protein [bacterium]
MNHLHQDKTLPCARAFSEYLNQFEFRALPDLDATRDYAAKMDIYAADLYIGKLAIYYSPRKKTYTLSCPAITVPAYRDVLKEKWRDFQNTLMPEAGHNGVSAYVDGSFMQERIGYGAVLVQKNRILTEISGSLDSQYNAHRQIAGELKAVLEALAWCQKNRIGELHIYYDYQGIEMWARGKWKAKTELTQKYQQFMVRQSMILHFHKVSAHSGNRWNEHADRLAKLGAEKNTPLQG